MLHPAGQDAVEPGLAAAIPALLRGGRHAIMVSDTGGYPIRAQKRSPRASEVTSKPDRLQGSGMSLAGAR